MVISELNLYFKFCSESFIFLKQVKKSASEVWIFQPVLIGISLFQLFCRNGNKEEKTERFALWELRPNLIL